MTDPSLTPATPSTPRLTLRVRPDTQEWGREDDDRWRADLAQLEGALRRELPDATLDPGIAPGGRGAAEVSDVIVALGSAGALTGMVEVIKAWIGAKPGRRRVKVDIDTGGQTQSVLVEADGLGAQELTSVVTTALGQGRGSGSADERDGSSRRE
jgi:hypothetical protein